MVQAGKGGAALRVTLGAIRLRATSEQTAPALPPLTFAFGPPPRERRAQPHETSPWPHKGRVRLGQTWSGYDSQIFNYAPTLPPTPSSASSPLINFTILNINFPPARLSRRRGKGQAE